MARRLIVFAAVVAAGLFGAACAEPAAPTLATESVTAEIAQAVWPTDPTLITDVGCPALDEAVIAQTSRCEAQLHGDPLTIDMVIDDLGATAVTLRQSLFDVDAAVDQIRERLLAELGTAVEAITVECDRTVMVALAGAVVACVAERDGDPIAFEVRLVDDTGQWTLTYVP